MSATVERVPVTREWYRVTCPDCPGWAGMALTEYRAKHMRAEHVCGPRPAHQTLVEQVDEGDYLVECRCGWQRGGLPTYGAAENASERHLEAA